LFYQGRRCWLRCAPQQYTLHCSPSSAIFRLGKAANDPAREYLVDLTVTGDRLGSAGPRIVVDIVPAAMSEKHAPSLFELLY
jgi:hypothetical protein